LLIAVLLAGTLRLVIPESHIDLLDTPVPSVLVTLLADGRPQASIVWFDFIGGVIRVNSEEGRLKVRNMQRDGRVTLLIVDPANQHRYLEIRGDVRSISKEGALLHRAALDLRYLGPGHVSDPANDKGMRLIVSIVPVKVVAYG
jgi:PPOX class probable F420-dependent enzyme